MFMIEIQDDDLTGSSYDNGLQYSSNSDSSEAASKSSNVSLELLSVDHTAEVFLGF